MVLDCFTKKKKAQCESLCHVVDDGTLFTPLPFVGYKSLLSMGDAFTIEPIFCWLKPKQSLCGEDSEGNGFAILHLNR